MNSKEIASPQTLEKPAKAGPETILVVEDEPDLRDLVVQVLESGGYLVRSAATGVEALKEWSGCKQDIDLLLTDMVMPDGMTGWQLAERLREDAPHLRVIFTSGHSAGIPGTQFEHIDARHFLPKPYRPSTLIEFVRNSLREAA